MVWEKTLETPLDHKEVQPVQPKGDQSWVFIGRTDAKAETPTLNHLMQRADSFEKTLRLGKMEGRRRRGQQRMKQLDGITGSNGLEFEQTSQGDGEGQGGLVCCSPWSHKKLNTTEPLN